MPIDMPDYAGTITKSNLMTSQAIKDRRENILAQAAEKRRQRAEEREEQAELRREEMHDAALTQIQGQNISRLFQIQEAQRKAKEQQFVADLGANIQKRMIENRSSDNPLDEIEIMDEELTNSAGKPGAPPYNELLSKRQALRDSYVEQVKKMFPNPENNPEIEKRMVDYLNNSWYGKKVARINYDPSRKEVVLENPITGEKQVINESNMKLMESAERIKKIRAETRYLEEGKPKYQTETQKATEQAKLKKLELEIEEKINKKEALSTSDKVGIEKLIMSYEKNIETAREYEDIPTMQRMNARAEYWKNKLANEEGKQGAKGGKQLTKEIAIQYLDRYGNKDEAEKQARKDGYDF